jgi:hypothetical protein
MGVSFSFAELFASLSPIRFTNLASGFVDCLGHFSSLVFPDSKSPVFPHFAIHDGRLPLCEGFFEFLDALFQTPEGWFFHGGLRGNCIT